MSLQDQFKEDERAGFIKQIADKLYQGIVEAYDTPEAQKRRWIWELVQNAKDVTNSFGKVLIRITLQKDSILFEHNGDPFLTKSLTGLIQQVSSKDFKSNDATTTGKFGTGFISTHMLSKKITVDGLLEYGDQYKSFRIELDRDAPSPEALAFKVEQLLKTKDSLTDDVKFPPILKISHIRSQHDYDSKFLYDLKTGTDGYAKQGLEDLMKTGPYALLINDKIGEFEISNHTDTTTTILKQSNLDTHNYPVNIFSTDITTGADKAVLSLAYEQTEKKSIIVSVPIKIVEGVIKEVLPLPFSVPVLFKEFPLIGTEAWMFAFTIHAEEFQPKEPRDGLRLHIETEEDSGQAKTNRKLLGDAMKLALGFVKKLSEAEPCIENLHLLAQSSLPIAENKSDVIEFLKKLQLDYRTEIKTLKLVQTVSGPKTMTDCKFPLLEHRELPVSTANRDFFNICTFRHGHSLPIEKDYPEWVRILESEIDSWGKDLTLSLKDVLQETREWGSINLISSSDEKNNTTVIEWLNSLYKFLSNNKLESIHKDYQLIPNQKGNLILLVDAIKDSDKNIPEELKDAAETFGKKYRENLADDRICCNELHNAVTVLSISKDLAGDIGNLKKPEALEPAQTAALIKLCSIPTGLTTADDNRRTAMVKHLSAMIPEWREVMPPIAAMSDFNFNPAMRVLVRWALYNISQEGTIKVLQAGLFEKETDEKVVIWLDGLVQLVTDYDDFSSYLDTNAIYPNQLGNFCLKNNLSADIDTIPDDIKDIHDSILPEYSLRKKLLDLNFKADKVPGKITFMQVASEIDQELKKNEANLESINIRDAALNIVNWLSDEENKKYVYMFSWIEANKATIVLKTLDKDREHIFKILRSNQDFKKLANIAASKNFDAIAEIVESDYNITDLKKIYDMAVKAGGVAVVEEKLAYFLEEKQDLTFRTELGTHVENLFRDTLKAINPNFEVNRDPIGQDFILTIPGKWNYHVEIKSHAIGRRQVHMSILQGEKAAEFPDNYALCVMERPLDLNLANIPYFKQHSLFVPDIGTHLKDRVSAAQQITTILDQNNSEEGGIDFDSRDYRYRIGQKIYTGNSSLSFEKFMKHITVLILLVK